MRRWLLNPMTGVGDRTPGVQRESESTAVSPKGWRPLGRKNQMLSVPGPVLVMETEKVRGLAWASGSTSRLAPRRYPCKSQSFGTAILRMACWADLTAA